jgi:hypothetical protein
MLLLAVRFNFNKQLRLQFFLNNIIAYILVKVMSNGTFMKLFKMLVKPDVKHSKDHGHQVAEI